MNVTPRANHVRGHQDTLRSDLNKWEEMNVIVDKKAKLVLWESIQEGEEKNIGWLESEVISPVAMARQGRSRFIASYLKRNLEKEIVSQDIKKY